jgi:TonB family protein
MNETRILERHLTPWLLAAFFILAQPVLGLEDRKTVVELNNDGIKALNKGNTKAAIEKFEAALRKDPGYRLAQDNLAIAHNNYALQLRKTDTEQAIKHFHAALFYNPNNLTTKNNLESTMRAVGMDPRSFKDRVVLGDKALKEKDYMGAKVEYEAALSIEEGADVQKKLKTTKEMLAKTQPVDAVKKKPIADIPQLDFGPYMADLQRRIRRAYHYAGESSTGRPSMVVFRIHKDGSLSDLKTSRSCGVTAEDEALMKAVNDAAPFLPLPAGARDYEDIQFKMNGCPVFRGSPRGLFRRFE